MEEQIAVEVMDERLQRLQALLGQQQFEFNKSVVGRTCDILLERKGKFEGQLIGKSPWLQSTHVDVPGLQIGDMVSVKLNEAGYSSVTGEVLMEAVRYDEQAQIVSGSLMDYGLPRADDVPWMQTSLAGTESPNSELGVKGVGEVASIGAPGALINAVLDALQPYQIEHLDIPLTPLKIWQAINAATTNDLTLKPGGSRPL